MFHIVCQTFYGCESLRQGKDITRTWITSGDPGYTSWDLGGGGLSLEPLICFMTPWVVPRKQTLHKDRKQTIETLRCRPATHDDPCKHSTNHTEPPMFHTHLQMFRSAPNQSMEAFECSAERVDTRVMSWFSPSESNPS